MAHPEMFRDDDPVLARVRQAALGLPGAAEKISHGRPAFFTSKVFVYYGGSVKVDGVYVQHPQSVMVRLDVEDHAALLAEPRSFVPAYLGASGWLGLDLLPAEEDGGEAVWSELAEWLDASYRLTATKRLIAELDARRGAR